MCVGSCHRYTALRADYREQLAKAKKELGFRYVRFHGILNDDMCVVQKDRAGNICYNFFNIDNIIDYLLRIDMKPFIEPGFMPTALASGTDTVFHYKGNITLPADFEQWDAFISEMMHHLIERYGLAEVQQWFFEVWNEPNLRFFFAEGKAAPVTYRRGILTEMIKQANKDAGTYPLYYTEWNTSSHLGDDIHDYPHSSALLTKTVLDNAGYVNAYSFWTFTDIFEEPPQTIGEFHHGFGLQTVHGIPKPVYRAFELLHQLGTKCYPRPEEQGTVGLVATADAENAVILRVDEEHANPRKLWEEMLPVTAEEDGCKVTFTLPPQGIALVKFL